MDSAKPFEKFLQNYRFCVIRSLLKGDVLDFSGNKGELAKYVKGTYTTVNYDHAAMENKRFDTIVILAVIEHIQVEEVYDIFNKFKTVLNRDGHIVITTPARIAKPVLGLLAFFGLLDKKNLAEHKHYWGKQDIIDLAEKTGFTFSQYKKFQVGFNQLAVFRHTEL